MPTKIYTRRNLNDAGQSNVNASEPFDDIDFSAGIAVNRSYFTRFINIDIPDNATVNSAYLGFGINKKDAATAGGGTLNIYREYNATDNRPGGMFDIGIEYPESSRQWANVQSGPWVYTANSGTSWNTYDITSMIQQSIGAGKSWKQYGTITLRLMVTGITSGADMNIIFDQNWQLTIAYTDGTPITGVVVPDLFSNGSMTSIRSAAASPVEVNGWDTNPAFGAYEGVGVTRITASSAPGSPTTLGGTPNLYVAKVGLSNTKPTLFNSSGNNLYNDGWYCFSAWVYMPVGQPDFVLDNLYHSTSAPVTTRGSWVRVSHVFLSAVEYNNFLGIRTTAAASAAGQFMYVTGVSCVPVDYDHAFFNGDTSVIPGATAQWLTTGRSGNSRLVVTNQPSAPSVAPPADQSTAHSGTPMSWTPNGTQEKYRVQFRRVS